MGANISFDAEKLIGKLNLIEKSLIPQARHRALHDLGQYLRKFHAREMESVFNEPRKYTTSSVLYKVKGDTLTLFIREDIRQSPARYLEPQTMSPGQYLKSALVTGFSGQLRRYGITHQVAYANPKASAARRFVGKGGKVRGSFYTKTLGGLNALEAAGKTRGRDGRYFRLETHKNGLEPGIYLDRKRAGLSRIFTLEPEPRKVRPRFDWLEASREEVIDQLPVMLGRRLRDLLR